MKEIVPGIFTWPWFSERHGYDFNGYLIRLPGGNLAVDPVEMSDEVLEELVREGVRRIVLTNRNHYRAAGKLKARTGASVAVHPADAEFVRRNSVAVDEELSQDQKIGPLTVVDAHGKSPGEIALHWPERKLLLVGDACVGKTPGALSLLPPKVIDDLAALQESIRRLAKLEVDAVLVGDGTCVLRGGSAALRALAETFAT
ncbi:MAG: MBL fold metallo-hydrolase [Deltaproteobacteria bacterium]|nr:MAG: MBL fold metallo-hydrolase [Deltaproteobacteria bacterium]